MLLFYVRHGDPIYNPDSLTVLGEEQAQAIKYRLCQFGLDKIYSSDSNRAYQTAKPTADLLKLEIEQLPWCNESLCYDDLRVVLPTGAATWCYAHHETRLKLVREEVRVLGKRWYEHPDFKNTRFKEGIERIQRETDKFMLNLGFRHDGDNNVYIPEKPTHRRVALFAHEGFGAAFLSCLLDIPYPQFSTHFTMTHSALTVIEFAENQEAIVPRILTYSNDSHIFAKRLPLKYQNQEELRF